MATIESAFRITAGHEGLYANNPRDTGGETYSGVARKKWPNWQGWPIIDAIKKRVGTDPKAINREAVKDTTLSKHIKDFYFINFWMPNRLGELNSQAIANELYDTGVNMGTGRAAMFLQEALNLTNNNGVSYPNIEVDGKIGPITLKFANQHPRTELLLKVLNMLQGEFYLKIMRSNPTQEGFANSWFSRVTV